MPRPPSPRLQTRCPAEANGVENTGMSSWYFGKPMKQARGTLPGLAVLLYCLPTIVISRIFESWQQFPASHKFFDLRLNTASRTIQGGTPNQSHPNSTVEPYLVPGQ